MERTVLVTSAGSALANNLVRGLRAADPSIVLLGCHTDRFVLKKSSADRNYLLPSSSREDGLRAMRRLLENETVTLVIPSTDGDVSLVAELRAEFPDRVFLPRDETIALCQDKYELTFLLRARGLPAPLTYPVATLDEVEEIFRLLGAPRRAWCRMRVGTCSMGATPVRTPAQTRAWIEYWQDMRGVPEGAFTISEYLPGRDFACQSLWKDGKLVLVKTFERLSYVGGPSRPSGVSSIAALARTVVEPRVAEVCAAVVRAVDSTASGVFSIDLKERADGTPCVTEINAGRFFTMLNLFDAGGKHAMTSTYVRLALDEPVDIDEPYDVVEDYYAVRDVDTLPDILHADEIFENIQEVQVSTEVPHDR